MIQEDLNKTLKLFDLYSEMPYVDFLSDPEEARWYSHKEEDYFHIIVLSGNKVYQTGTEADTIGIELETYKDLQIRFKSMTGCDVEYFIERNYGDEDSI